MKSTAFESPRINTSSPTQARWFSANPDRAWAEKFFLAYSPVWMIMMGIMMPTGWVREFSDAGLIAHALLVAAPLFLIPLAMHRALVANGRHSAVPWYQSYWCKANIYIFIFGGLFGNYFGSEYFFDVLGMVYSFPNATTVADAAMLGSGEQQVPVIMYLYSHAYFMTYHTTAILVLRRFMTSALPARQLMFAVAVVAVGYFWAWLETKAMANPMIAANFHYLKMDLMLAYGSFIYATYFVASFPIFYFLDEDRTKPWSLWVVCGAGLSASMLTFFMLDFAAHLVGSL